MVLIGHASLDEYGNIAGGAAGDQTGREVFVCDWWAMGWTQCVRAKSAEIAEKIAKAMEQACNNPFIGYDQSERLTLYYQARSYGYDLTKIHSACECDCSSLVAVCVIASGVAVNPDLYTGNEVAALLSTGRFNALDERQYLDSSDFLRRGDILVKQYSHTCVVLSDGDKIVKPDEKPDPDVMYAEKYDARLKGTYTPVTGLNMRAGAGTNHRVIEIVKPGDKLLNYGYYTDFTGIPWLYVQHGVKVGFCSSRYLRRL